MAQQHFIDPEEITNEIIISLRIALEALPSNPSAALEIYKAAGARLQKLARSEINRQNRLARSDQWSATGIDLSKAFVGMMIAKRLNSRSGQGYLRHVVEDALPASRATVRSGHHRKSHEIALDLKDAFDHPRAGNPGTPVIKRIKTSGKGMTDDEFDQALSLARYIADAERGDRAARMEAHKVFTGAAAWIGSRLNAIRLAEKE